MYRHKRLSTDRAPAEVRLLSVATVLSGRLGLVGFYLRMGKEAGVGGVQLNVGTWSNVCDCGTPCDCCVAVGFESKQKKGFNGIVSEGKEERIVLVNKSSLWV